MTTHNPEHSLLLNSTVWVLDRNGKMKVGTTDELISEKTLRGLYTSEICVLEALSEKRKVCFVNKLP
jgi:ABC-type cobalamin/Fe3+-siderophores transport system ATPase subunit